MTKKVIIQNLHIITFMMMAILVGCSNNIENNKKPSADNMQTTKKATITDSQQTKEDTVVKVGIVEKR